MHLILLRHGIAHDRMDPGCPPDFERELTGKGRRRTRAAVEGLRALGVAPDVVGASRLVRAVQTAEIAREVLGPAEGELLAIEALEPDGDPAEVLAAAGETGAECVLLAGHAPNLDLVVAEALGVGQLVTRLGKAGAACLELAADAPARLAWLFEPRALRRLGGS